MGVWWWRFILAALAGILFTPQPCASQIDAAAASNNNYSFMENANSAPNISYYDYIVIGGGTAGCPLAATLSQNYSVLVLERGGSPYGNPNISNVGAFGAALSDTSPTSPSQRFISQDGVINARARVLGGGSCLNAGFYTRASPQYVREVGWEGKAVNESYEWVERFVAFEPEMRQWQSAVRDGLLQTGVVPYNGFTYDHINGTKVGGTIFDPHGQRHTAADLLQYANATGITVLLHATVHRILFRIKGESKPVAHGVVFRDSSGKKHKAYLKHGPKNEIIVSAGALGSPQLLMLSGVGPEDQLRAHNISIVLEQPLVGQGMSDNPMNAIFTPSPVPVELSLIQVVGITSFGAYIEAASGANFGGSSPRDYGMFSPKIGQLSNVPPKQRTPEALAKAIQLMDRLEAPAFQGGFILEKIMGPISTGHLELRNRDPNENPLVTFNYFQDPRDLEKCVQGISTIEKIIESKAFSPFRYENVTAAMLLNMTARSPVNLLPKHANTSTSLEQFCRDTVMTIWHYHGGCQVGRVVDRDYKVLGVDALRVIDGSTFNYSPGTNPQATVMMLGRYMGLKILRDRLACDGEASHPCFNGCFPSPFLASEESHTSVNVTISNYDFAAATSSSLPPNTQFTNHEALPSLNDSYLNFTKAYPPFSNTFKADQIRAQEYRHLNLSNLCFDYTGYGLFSYAQHQGSCPTTSIASSSSHPPPSLPYSALEPPFFDISYKSVNLHSQIVYGGQELEIESRMRERIMAFMNISEADYTLVFTANQLSAFKLVADSFQFLSNGSLLTVYDHNSEALDEMIKSCKMQGAHTLSAEFSWPDLRVQTRKLKEMILSKRDKRKRGLFVFPVHSRVTGAPYSYIWMSMAQENGWHVLLDACALAPKEMDTLGLSLFKPDFLVCSFYKVLGENPSGFGCLFVKKSSISAVKDSANATSVGIVSLVPAFRQSHFPEPDEEIEPKPEMELQKGESDQSRHRNLEIECRGLDHADAVGLIVISSRGRYLANWLVHALKSLQHPHLERGLSLIKIYGPKINSHRGPAVAFNVFDWKGEKVDPLLVQKLADRNNISLCHAVLQNVRFSDKNEESRICKEEGVRLPNKKPKHDYGISVVTAALNFLTNFQDIYRLWAFLSRFLDADFVEKERWRYKALNQKTVEL